jgi:hypothetical protein
MRFKLKDERGAKERLPVHVRFSYYDLEQKREVVQEQQVFLTVSRNASAELLRDLEVRKNFTVALLAQAIYDMAVAWESKSYEKAETLATAALARAYERYPNLEDKDILYTLNILQKYQEAARKYNQQQRRAALN